VFKKGMPAERFDRAHRKWKIDHALGGKPATPAAFVEAYTRKHSITVRYNGIVDMPKEDAADLDPDTKTLERDLCLQNAELRLGFRETPIKHALSAWVDQQRNARRRAVKSALFCGVAPVAEEEWQWWANALVDTNAVSPRYSIAAGKTFMWQVKRRIVGLPVRHHLMMVFYGPQGSGKSSAVRQLCEPLGDLVAAVDFSQFTDTKNMQLWTHPVVFCDEMDKASRKEVGTIKNAITKEYNSDRGHGSHGMVTVRNGTVPVGACNGFLSDIIRDTTGMRRFGPIPTLYAPTPENINAGRAVVNWDALAEIDVTLLWQSVDHTAAHPMEADPEAMAEWRRVCEQERTPEPVELWLEQVAPGSFRLQAGETFTTDELIADYTEWCQRANHAPCSVTQLGKALTRFREQSWYPFVSAKGRGNRTQHSWADHAKERSRGSKRSSGTKGSDAPVTPLIN
jgi:hypothetical protein